MPPRPEQLAKVAQDAFGLLDVLDRLEEDQRVAGLRVVLHEITHEAHSGTRVLEPRVLVGFRVGIHAGHAPGAPGENLHAVALAAGHVDHFEAAAALRHPLVDGQVTAKPVVLGRHVGQRALAGQLERGHAGGLTSAPCPAWAAGV